MHAGRLAVKMAVNRKKLTIIGAGNLGSQAAFYAALKGIADIVMVDIVEGMPQGKALDMLEAMPIARSGASISGSSSYVASRGSDVVIITAGIPRKPGMSREDLMGVNAKIIRSVVPEVVRHSPDCKLIVVTNPIDAMVHLAYELSGFPKQRVMGMAGVLDTARFRAFVAEELKVSVNDVDAVVLGSHGDLMVPLVSHCKVNGKPISGVMGSVRIAAIVERTRNGGAEIVNLLKTGSAFFAPALSAVEMAESILLDQKKVLPCSALLEGEYGEKGIFAGVPAVLGIGGVEKIVELPMSDTEKEAFRNAASHIRNLVNGMKEALK